MKNLYYILLAGVLSHACALSQSSIPEIVINRLSPEIEAFEAFDKTARYPLGTVLFTGSSSIRFWESLSADMSPVSVINRGFGGSTLPEVLHFYYRIITKFQPSIVVLYCGENDIWMGRSVQDVVLDYRAFIKKTKASLPDTKVVYISMKPSPARWEKWNDFKRANREIKNIIDRHNDQFYIDVSEKMFNESGEPIDTIFVQDMLHMNSEGYQRWAALIRPIIHEMYKTK